MSTNTKTEREKIKICHIAHKLTGKSDGVWTHLKMLFELLEKDRFEQILMYSGNEENINMYAKSVGIKVYNIQELNKKIPVKLFFNMLNTLKKENVDIIHTHLVKPYIFAGLINLFLGKKLIFNYQGIFLSRFYYSRIENALIKLLHNIIQFINNGRDVLAIAPSKNSAKELIENGIRFNKILHYYNGFRISCVRNDILIDKNVVNFIEELKKKYFLICIVARHEKQKRLDIALEVLNKLINEKLNVFFVFIGDGPQFIEIQNLAQKIGVRERSHFIEYLNNLPYYLHLFDLMLFTSEWEGFPLTIWEAMYYGVPILSSDVGGIKEILEQESCGIVYPFGDVDKCVEIIKELYFNNEKLKLLGENGRRAILTKYNEKQFKEFFVNLYTELVNEK